MNARTRLDELAGKWRDAGSPVDAELERSITELEQRRRGILERQRELQSELEALTDASATR